MDLELLEWGDGTIRLSFWDSSVGADRHFILDQNGSAKEKDDQDVCQPINLVIELRKMLLERMNH